MDEKLKIPLMKKLDILYRIKKRIAYEKKIEIGKNNLHLTLGIGRSDSLNVYYLQNFNWTLSRFKSYLYHHKY